MICIANPACCLSSPPYIFPFKLQPLWAGAVMRLTALSLCQWTAGVEEAYKRTAGNVPTGLWLDSHFVPILSQIGISFSVLDHFQYIRTFFFFLILILKPKIPFDNGFQVPPSFYLRGILIIFIQIYIHTYICTHMKWRYMYFSCYIHMLNYRLKFIELHILSIEIDILSFNGITLPT